METCWAGEGEGEGNHVPHLKWLICYHPESAAVFFIFTPFSSSAAQCGCCQVSQATRIIKPTFPRPSLKMSSGVKSPFLPSFGGESGATSGWKQITRNQRRLTSFLLISAARSFVSAPGWGWADGKGLGERGGSVTGGAGVREGRTDRHTYPPHSQTHAAPGRAAARPCPDAGCQGGVRGGG